MLAPKSNPLLAVEELCFVKQGSMDSGARATKRTEVMERIRDRIILEHKDLPIIAINLENPKGLRESA